MTPQGYGEAFAGMARLAMFGAAALVAAAVIVLIGVAVGVPLLLWWLWHHVAIV